MENQCDSSDDALIARYLGSRYLGRRYLRYAELEALGICDNRGSLVNWIAAGAFPPGIKIPSRYGKTLVWDAVEVSQHIAQRCAERDPSPP
jgi:predicted DNA-binding transcriptional regulator AlpA